MCVISCVISCVIHIMSRMQGHEAWCPVAATTAAAAAFVSAAAADVAAACLPAVDVALPLLLLAASRPHCAAGTFEAAARASALQRVDQAGAGGSSSSSSPRPLRLALSACLWASLQRAASQDVFLPQLADRLARLQLQLLARYCTWLSDVATNARAAAAASAAAVATPAADAAADVEVHTAAGAAGAAGAAVADTPSTQESTPAAVGPAAWAGSMSPEDCANICMDADAIKV
jgi:hypothetical protein